MPTPVEGPGRIQHGGHTDRPWHCFGDRSNNRLGGLLRHFYRQPAHPRALGGGGDAGGEAFTITWSPAPRAIGWIEHHPQLLRVSSAAAPRAGVPLAALQLAPRPRARPGRGPDEPRSNWRGRRGVINRLLSPRILRPGWDVVAWHPYLADRHANARPEEMPSVSTVGEVLQNNRPTDGHCRTCEGKPSRSPPWPRGFSGSYRPRPLTASQAVCGQFPRPA